MTPTIHSLAKLTKEQLATLRRRTEDALRKSGLPHSKDNGELLLSVLQLAITTENIKYNDIIPNS